MSLLHSVLFKVLMKNRTFYDPKTPKDYASARSGEIASAAYERLPKSVRLRGGMLGGVPTEWVEKDGNPRDRIVLYIHGGGFVTGCSEARRGLTAHIAGKLGFNVVSIDYRLAPEHPFPAGAEDCLAAYRALLDYFPAGKIVLLGESAGGNLALSLLVQIKEEGLPFPAACFAIAPTVQYDRELPSYRSNLPTDCIVTNLLDEVWDVYLRSRDEEVCADPVAAPYHGDFSGCTPVVLWASESEVLLDDSLLMFEKLKEQKVTTKLYLRRGMMHTWLIIPALPEAKKDLQILGGDIRLAFDGALESASEPIRLG